MNDGLKTDYDNACNAYVQAFCEKHGLDYHRAYWVGDRTGGVVDIDETFADMPTLIDDIEMDAPEDEFQQWYDHCSELRFLGVEPTPNYHSWLSGCPRMSEPEMNELWRARRRVEDARNYLEEDARNYLEKLLKNKQL